MIGPMAAEASVNAMYAKKIAEIDDPDERAAYVAERTEEQRADIDLLRVASELVVERSSSPSAAHRARDPARRRRRLVARTAAAPPPVSPV